MILHPEFMRLLKRELSWPLVALVLVISGLGWWNTQQDFEEIRASKSTVSISSGQGKESKNYPVSIATQEGCVRELMAQSGIDAPDAESRCVLERRELINQHFMYFVIVVNISLIVAAARVISGLHNDFKNNTWDYQRLGTHAPWRLALAKILGGAALAFFAVFLNATVFLALAPTPHLQNLGNVAFTVLAVGMAAAVPFLAYVYQVVETRTPSLLLVWGTSIVSAGFLNAFLPVGLTDLNIYWRGEKKFTFLEFVFPEIPAAIMVSVILILFLFVGASRLLNAHQKSIQKPWFFILSVFTLGFYFYGIHDPESTSKDIFNQANFPGIRFLSIVFLLCCGVTYCTCLLGNRSLLRYRRLEWTRQETGRLPWREMPVWVYMLLCAGGALALSVLSIGIFGKNPQGSVLLLQAFGFIVRDIAILHITTLRRSEGQGDMLALLAFFVLYVMMSGLLPDAYDQLVVPTEDTGIAGLVLTWGQAAGCLVVLRYIWQRQAGTVPAVVTPAPASV